MASTCVSYAPFMSRPGTTFADAVRYIADVCGWRTGPLPPALNVMTEHYGWCSFGLSFIDLGSIAELFPGLEWDIKEGHLHMEHDDDAAKAKAKAAKQLSPFHALAGELMVNAVRNGRRLAVDEYERIARELDALRFSLRDNLEPAFQDKLKAWNQKHSKTSGAVRTWAQAVACEGDIRRGALKTLNRAEELYRNRPATRL
jgi:hypothetical protein